MGPGDAAEAAGVLLHHDAGRGAGLPHRGDEHAADGGAGRGDRHGHAEGLRQVLLAAAARDGRAGGHSPGLGDRPGRGARGNDPGTAPGTRRPAHGRLTAADDGVRHLPGRPASRQCAGDARCDGAVGVLLGARAQPRPGARQRRLGRGDGHHAGDRAGHARLRCGGPPGLHGPRRAGVRLRRHRSGGRQGPHRCAAGPHGPTGGAGRPCPAAVRQCAAGPLRWRDRVRRGIRTFQPADPALQRLQAGRSGDGRRRPAQSRRAGGHVARPRPRLPAGGDRPA